MATIRRVIVDTDAGSTRDYASLNAAIAGEAADLVALDRQLIIECRASTGVYDTTTVEAASFTGYVVDTTRNIIIEAGAGHEASFKFLPNRYCFSGLGSNTFARPVTIRRIQALKNDGTSTPIGFNTFSGRAYIESCYIDGSTHTIAGSGNANVMGVWNSVQDVTIRNCFFYRGSSGYKCGAVYTHGGNWTIENCSYYSPSNARFYHGVDATVTIRNCVGINPGPLAVFSDADVATNNASSDASAPGANSLTGLTATQVFADPSTGDLRPAFNAPTLGAGADLSTDFTTDFNGTKIGTWPIGAISTTSWMRRAPLVIQSSQVPSLLSDFPVLLTKDTLPAEMFDADGTYPAQNGGGDLRFTTDAAGLNQIPCEVVSFVTDNDPANGFAEIWVKVPSVSATVGTTFYVWYNTAGADTQPAVTDTYGRNAVWSDYLAVLHLNSASYVDSTGNGYNATAVGSPTQTSEAHPWGGTWTDFNGAGNYLTIPTGSALDNSFVSVSAMYRRDGTGGSAALEGIVSNRLQTQDQNWFQLTIFDTGLTGIVSDGVGQNLARMDYNEDTTDVYWGATTSSAIEQKVYHNGVVGNIVDDTIASDNQFTTTLNTTIGDYYILGNGQYWFNGKVGEVRLRLGTLTADWYAAEYNNQSSPATFVVEGTPQPSTPQARFEWNGDFVGTTWTATSPSVPVGQTVTRTNTTDITIETVATLGNMRCLARPATAYQAADVSFVASARPQHTGFSLLVLCDPRDNSLNNLEFLQWGTGATRFSLGTVDTTNTRVRLDWDLFGSAAAAYYQTTRIDGPFWVWAAFDPDNPVGAERLKAAFWAYGTTPPTYATLNTGTFEGPAATAGTFEEIEGLALMRRDASDRAAAIGLLVIDNDPAADMSVYLPSSVADSRNRRAPLVIQSSQVSATLTDFPLLLTKDTLPSEMFDADGAFPAQNGGGDIRFTTDPAGMNRIPCEVVSFVTNNDPALGSAEIWVKVPSVSNTVNTTIHVWYNTAGTEAQPVVTDAYGRNAVWSDYEAVHHFENGSGVDSAGSAHNFNQVRTGTPGTLSGVFPFGSGIALHNTIVYDNTQYTTDFIKTNPWSVSVWGVSGANNAAPQTFWHPRSIRDIIARVASDYNLEFAWFDGSQTHLQYFPASAVTTNVPRFISLSCDGAATLNFKSENNSPTNYYATYGTPVAFDNNPVNPESNQIGGIDYSGVDSIHLLQSGGISELRVASVFRSLSWYDAEYANQNDPATFVVEGAGGSTTVVGEDDATTYTTTAVFNSAGTGMFFHEAVAPASGQVNRMGCFFRDGSASFLKMAIYDSTWNLLGYTNAFADAGFENESVWLYADMVSPVEVVQGQTYFLGVMGDAGYIHYHTDGVGNQWRASVGQFSVPNADISGVVVQDGGVFKAAVFGEIEAVTGPQITNVTDGVDATFFINQTGVQTLGSGFGT